jgi:membrane-bound lytic murein transglycosylase B
MKRTLILALCLMAVWAAAAHAITKPAGVAAEEEHRKAELRSRLCADRDLSCAYITALFNDARLKVYDPPEPAPPPPSLTPKDRERNPYLTRRFGLLTPESLERCRDFVQAHLLAFDAAYKIYGVPKEVICGHLRIETDFGIPTGLSPHPLGTIPAINRLVTLYVRRPSRNQTGTQFARRQTFALDQLKELLQAASNNGWDLFQIPGSSTGAIGLAQFEPSSFKIAVDGDGDGKIDLFNPEDAILSVAHYLTTRGWDKLPQHQYRAIYAYYGGHYDTDPNKYYMKAVLKYAVEIHNYLQDHPVESGLVSLPRPFPLPQQDTVEPPIHTDEQGLKN